MKIGPTIFFAGIAIFFCVISVVNANFNDMYGKLFQVELLDDCSVYYYDRVEMLPGISYWCKRPKSYMNPHAYFVDSDTYVGVVTFYVDDDNVLNYLYLDTDAKHEKYSYKLLSQDYIEAKLGTYYNVSTQKPIELTATNAGRYTSIYCDYTNKFYFTYESCKYNYTSSANMVRYIKYNSNDNNVIVQERDSTTCDQNAELVSLYTYNFCKYNHTSDVNMIRYVQKNSTGKHIIVEKRDSTCDPNLVFDDVIKGRRIVVRVDPQDSSKRLCRDDSVESVIYPIKKSIQTTVLAYNRFPNFANSFPLIYTKKIVDQLPHSYTGVFLGVTDGKLTATNGETVKRPPVDDHYNLLPFFFVNHLIKELVSYSPIFLYYKHAGSSRDFTISYFKNGEYKNLFEPIEYMERCNFKNEESAVIASPKVLYHNQTTLSFEVYFLLNNADLQYCVLEVHYKYAMKNYTIVQKQASKVNAYVHVESRSETAVNCDFGNRTVRWLLAYTEGKEAELVSLDDDVSSPIFPCTHCGPGTLMYCDARPKTVKTYDSAVYIVTGNKILYVGIKRDGYIKKIEYYAHTMASDLYFAQQMPLDLSFEKASSNFWSWSSV